MDRLNLDTFWGSSLAFALNNYPLGFNYSKYLLISVLALFDYTYICNLIISDSDSFITAISSAFLLDIRFKNSFKSGERILLSQLASKLVASTRKCKYTGWPAFFLFLNIFPFIAPILFRKRFSLIPVGAWIVLSASFTLDRFILFDLFAEIMKNTNLVIYWILTLSITISAPLVFPLIFRNQNSLRKFYHFAAVALFIPAAFASLKILQIALAVAASLFLLLETLRTEANNRGHKLFALYSLNEFMERCRNELDSGEMIFSHLYLLLGCAIPFWLNGDQLKMSSFAGVISLGIGDSLASIGGKSFGRTRWHFKTRKTIEGSLCGCIGMVLSWYMLVIMLMYKIQDHCIPQYYYYRLLFVSVASSIWEALIDLNDNITLPIFTFIIIKLLQDFAA